MLKKLLILLLAIFCFNEYGMPTTEALEGAGVRVLQSNDFPFSVAVINLNIGRSILDQYVCGGTLITRKHVLLSGIQINKQYPTSSYRVLAGSHDLTSPSMQSYNIDSYTSYDHWAINIKRKPRHEHSELAVAQLRREITDSNIRPISLSPIQLDDLHNIPVVMAGWDHTIESLSSRRFIKRVDLKILTTRECGSFDPNLRAGSHDLVRLLLASRTLMCSKAGESVAGTHGSESIPVFTNAPEPQLVGIFSGSMWIPTRGRRYVHYVTVLDFYREFIQDMTRA